MLHIQLIRLAVCCVSLLAIAGCATSADHINTTSSDLAAELTRGIAPGSQMCVAVVPVTDKTRQSSGLCSTLRERITNELVRSHTFQIVDQANLDQVLQTLKVQDDMCDAMDRGTLARLHELVGAQAIVVGTITDAQSDFDVQFRLLDVSKDIVLASASGSIPKSDMAGVSQSDTRDTSLQPILAPIALYPDPLVADVLPAATYPDQIHQAALWVKDHPGATDEQIYANEWDPSVQSVAHYPTVIASMDNDPRWTESLGAAFSTEQPQVLATIQDLRAQAYGNGSLATSRDMRVTREQDEIAIEPADGETVVPTYDPVVVYQERAPIVFQRVRSFNAEPSGIDWNHHFVYHDNRSVARRAAGHESAFAHVPVKPHRTVAIARSQNSPKAMLGKRFVPVPSTHIAKNAPPNEPGPAMREVVAQNTPAAKVDQVNDARNDHQSVDGDARNHHKSNSESNANTSKHNSKKNGDQRVANNNKESAPTKSGGKKKKD